MAVGYGAHFNPTERLKVLPSINGQNPVKERVGGPVLSAATGPFFPGASGRRQGLPAGQPPGPLRLRLRLRPGGCGGSVRSGLAARRLPLQTEPVTEIRALKSGWRAAPLRAPGSSGPAPAARRAESERGGSGCAVKRGEIGASDRTALTCFLRLSLIFFL